MLADRMMTIAGDYRMKTVFTVPEKIETDLPEEPEEVLPEETEIENGLPVLLHGHPHLDAQLAFINRIGVGGQVVGFLKKCKKIVFQMLRCTFYSVEFPAFKVIKGNRMQFVGKKQNCTDRGYEKALT